MLNVNWIGSEWLALITKFELFDLGALPTNKVIHREQSIIKNKIISFDSKQLQWDVIFIFSLASCSLVCSREKWMMIWVNDLIYFSCSIFHPVNYMDLNGVISAKNLNGKSIANRKSWTIFLFISRPKSFSPNT